MRHEKAALLLDLARLLAGSAEGMTLDEMAAAMHVNRRTVERMRVAVAQLFPQIEEIAYGRGKRLRISGGLDGFIQAPTVDEMAELHTAINTLRARGDTTRAGLLESLQAKIRAALRPALRSRMAPDLNALVMAEGHAMQAGPRPLADPAALDTIRTALKAGCGLTFRYGNGANHVRTVSPWGLLYGRSYYLVGPCTGKAGPALWRLDRMNDITMTDMADPPPANWNIADFASRSFGVYQDEPQDIVLRFSPDAAHDAARFLFHPTQTHEERPDGSLVVRFHAGGLRELAYHLFTWGRTVEVLAPPALRRELHALLTEALQHHAMAAPEHDGG